ncbi:hypothetical protein FOA52_006337 [Chlamydomonas sp. UWO 241]|nr:hypothetical protein FOA52_006337 [Chlamydomonas sp. UWO 241]
MVPVGGTIVAAGKKRPGLVEAMTKLYPGRASASAHVDLLMTLLHWGVYGWVQELRAREELYPYLRASLRAAAAALGERVLATDANPISLAMTLDGLDAPRPSPPAPNNAAAAAGGADGPAGAGRAAAAAMAAAGGTVGSAGAPADSPAGPGHSEAGRAAAAGGEQPPAAASGAPADGPAGPGQGGAGRAAAAAAAAAAGGMVDSAGAPGAVASDGRGGAPGGHAQHGAAAGARGGGGARPSASGAPSPPGPTFLGSMLFARCVSGTRVVPRGKAQEIAGHTFVGYGSHTDAYPHVYLTAAAAIGTTKGEVDEFVARLTKAYREFQAKQRAALAR